MINPLQLFCKGLSVVGGWFTTGIAIFKANLSNLLNNDTTDDLQSSNHAKSQHTYEHKSTLLFIHIQWLVDPPHCVTIPCSRLFSRLVNVVIRQLISWWVQVGLVIIRWYRYMLRLCHNLLEYTQNPLLQVPSNAGHADMQNLVLFRNFSLNVMSSVSLFVSLFLSSIKCDGWFINIKYRYRQSWPFCVFLSPIWHLPVGNSGC